METQTNTNTKTATAPAPVSAPVCLICQEIATHQTNTNFKPVYYCLECLDNEKTRLKEVEIYDKLTNNAQNIKDYLKIDKIKKKLKKLNINDTLKNVYLFMDNLIIDGKIEAIKKYIYIDFLEEKITNEINDNYKTIEFNFKIEAPGTSFTKLLYFEDIEDEEKKEERKRQIKKLTDYIDIDLIIKIGLDSLINKPILYKHKQFYNIFINNEDTSEFFIKLYYHRSILIKSIYYLFFDALNFDVKIFLNCHKEATKEKNYNIFLKHIENEDYEKAISKININKYLEYVYNESYPITYFNFEIEEEEEEEEELEQKENNHFDDLELRNDNIKYIKDLKNDIQDYYINFKKAIIRLNYYKDNYKNLIGNHTKATEYRIRQIIAGLKKDDEAYLIYGLVYLLYTEYKINIFDDNYKITFNNTLNIIIEDLNEDSEDYEIYILRNYNDEEALIFNKWDDGETLQYYNLEFKKRHLLEDFKNKNIMINKEGEEVINYLDEQPEIIENLENFNLIEVMNIRTAINDARNSDGLSHLLNLDNYDYHLFKNYEFYINKF